VAKQRRRLDFCRAFWDNIGMVLIKGKIPLAALKQMAQARFGDMVKAVVDVDRGLMAVDAELHADEEKELLEDGSKQESLWGINLYPEVEGPDWIEFDSMINLRPWQDNRSRGVDDPELRQRIIAVVEGLADR